MAEKPFFNKPKKQSETSSSAGITNIYCVCRSSNIDSFMISCDHCQEWFHGDCIGVEEESANNIDLYFCPNCCASNPELKTTFKSNRRKKSKRRNRKNRKSLNNNSPDCFDSSCGMENNSTTSVDLDFSETTKSSVPLTKDEKLAQIFESDTSHRKAKTVANANIKSHNAIFASHFDRKSKMAANANPRNINSGDQFDSELTVESCDSVESDDKLFSCSAKKNSKELKQCFGPGCVLAARSGSKYCSDECGIRLGTHRILEILPQRIQQWKLLPTAADELSSRKLVGVRSQQKEVRTSLGQLERKIERLHLMIEESRTSRATAVFEDSEEETSCTIYCPLCGSEVGARAAVRHLEGCYRRQERRLLLTGRSPCSGWSVFCDRRLGGGSYCKQLRALCPLHRKRAADDGKTKCGYPIKVENQGVQTRFCGKPRKQCTRHPIGWESIFRAQLDMEKLQLLVKLQQLGKEEEDLRREMAARGNLVALLMHQTIVH